MRSAVLFSVLASVTGINAQADAYQQCGGTGWGGATTCVSGFYCSFGNDWYSQCIPGSKPSSSTTVKTTSTLQTSTIKSTSTSKSTSKSTSTSISTSKSTSASTTKSSSTPTGTAQVCTATFTPVTAKAAIAALNPGWNLGNSLDAVPDEGSWNNPVATPEIFTRVKAQGFKSIRIPVTWAYHFATGSPSWNVVPAWMDRVETVVDQSLAAGFSVILNVHHDSWNWADPTVAGANYTAIQEQFGRLWTQIGTRFACKSEKLIFEPLNEPTGTTQEHADLLNTLNDIFLDVINKAGGYNSQRVVSLGGLGQDSIKTSQWFKRGTTYPNQPWGLQFHYYSPYDFIFGAWGKTTWGSDDDKAAMLNDFALFNGNFTGIPTFIGEWSASPAHTEPAARWKYVDAFVRTANKFGYSTVMWDNGNDNYDRLANKWRDPISVTATIAAAAGISNSLADSTTDITATTQFSSARLFHKVGDAVVAQSVTYLLNGNTISKITNAAGTALTSSQYSVSGGTVTFSAAYLTTLYSASTAGGIKETLTLTFSAGTPLALQIVQYTTPVIATKSYTISTLDVTKDFAIPVTWNGLPEIAAIKAVKADGIFLADDWTIYLPAIQQGGWTYGAWGYDANGLIVNAAGLAAIKAAAQTVTLTVEFFPRALGSNNVTLIFTQ